MDGIAAVLPFAIGVAISPVPIIAVILMLFSSRAKVNGPMFALGWAVALAVVCGIVIVAGDAASDSATTLGVSWSKILFGAVFLVLVLAARTWTKRPALGAQHEPPKWMVGIDSFVVVASLTIAGPVTSYLVGGESARTTLDATKEWLALHHDAVMTVLFLVLGVNLVSKGIPPLT